MLSESPALEANSWLKLNNLCRQPPFSRFMCAAHVLLSKRRTLRARAPVSGAFCFWFRNEGFGNAILFHRLTTHPAGQAETVLEVPNRTTNEKE